MPKEIPMLLGLYTCKRASSYEFKPCDEAFEEEYTHIDRRTFSDPEMLPGGSYAWHRQGENHRVEDGGICRDFPGRKRWCVMMERPENLRDFILKYGDVIISVDKECQPPRFKIIIYDDYIE